MNSSKYLSLDHTFKVATQMSATYRMMEDGYLRLCVLLVLPY